MVGAIHRWTIARSISTQKIRALVFSPGRLYSDGIVQLWPRYSHYYKDRLGRLRWRTDEELSSILTEHCLRQAAGSLNVCHGCKSGYCCIPSTLRSHCYKNIALTGLEGLLTD